MTKPISSRFVPPIIVSIVFACATIPAFAQHGGGGHGGFGGGGSHGGGGGFHGGGGGSHGGGPRGGGSSAPRTGGGSYRGGPAPAGAGAQSYARPGNYGSRPGGNPAYAGERGAAPYTATSSYARADGQWHSFAGPSAGSGAANAGSGFHVLGGSRSAGSGSVTRSFSGQGRDIWETTSASRNVVPASRALSTMRSSFSNASTSTRLSSSLRTQSSLMPFSARTTIGTGINHGFGGWNNSPWQFRGRVGFRGFRGGCWNCGFGFGGFGFGGFGFGWGPGWGFGWPYFGFWNSWDYPWWWDAPSPGYYGYPGSYNIYNYNYDSSSNNSSPSAPTDTYSNPDQNAPGQQPSLEPNATGSVESSATGVLLYLKDGPVYSARSYWLAGGKLHFTLDNGVESWIEIDRLDWQRTVDENARRGVQFTLRPGPDGSGSPPNTNISVPDHVDSTNLTLSPAD